MHLCVLPRLHGEGFAFDLDEKPTYRADRSVEFGALGVFQIAEETPGPRLDVASEEILLLVVGDGKVIAGKAAHHFAYAGEMILGLGVALGALDTETGHVRPQARKRAFVEEAGEIIGCVGKEFSASHANEQLGIFAMDRLVRI